MIRIRMMRLLVAAPAAALVGLTLVLPAPGAAREAHLPKNAKETFWHGRDGRFGLYRLNPKGGPPLRLTRAWGNDVASASPNGRTLAFQWTGAHTTSIYRVDVRGGGVRRLGSGFQPSWSPDGKRLAYTDGEGLWVMKADGTGKHKVAVDSYLEYAGYPPAWSPDGSKLAFVRCWTPKESNPCEHGSGFNLYTIELDGTHLHKVTPDTGLPGCPAWSRKGVLAFLGDGTTVVQKNGTLVTYPGGCPVWSPSGKQLAAATDTGVFVMHPDGSGRQSIDVAPPGPVDLNLKPAWSSDGKWLAVTSAPTDVVSHLWIVRPDGTRLKKVF